MEVQVINCQSCGGVLKVNSTVCQLAENERRYLCQEPDRQKDRQAYGNKRRKDPKALQHLHGKSIL